MDPKVEQFVSVTGAEVEEARSLLEACGGNLDLAVNMHMEGRPGLSSENKDTAGESYEDIHGVRAPIPQTTGRLIDEETPPTGRVFRSRRLPPTVFDPFQDYSRTDGQQQASKIQSLAELFKPPFDIMFQGSFQELRMAGQTQKKWLLVNLQDSKEFASQVLNRDVWSNDNIEDIISAHFLFWQIHRITDNGMRFKQLYNTTSFPYVAILDPRTGEKMASWESITASKFRNDLLEFLQENTFDEPSNYQKNSADITDLPEDLQLEAAIRASLQPTAATEAALIDNDDLISISSGQHDAESEVGSDIDEDNIIIISENKEDRVTRSVGRLSVRDLHSFRSQNNDYASNSVEDEKKKLPFTNHQAQKRKRRYSNHDRDVDLIPPLTKVVRSDCGEAETDGHHYNVPSGRAEKGVVTNIRKGKQRASSVAENSVEERLAAGLLQKEDISQLTFRLPDGTRIQKAFLCTSPLQDLITFIMGKGIDCRHHDFMTNFPRRSLLDLDHSLTLKQAGLYPSNTVFIQSKEYV